MVTHSIHLPVPALPPPVRSPIRPAQPVEVTDSFVGAMLDMPLSRQQRRNPLEWLVSLAVHAICIGALIAAPLYFTEAIDLKAFTQTFLVGPPPPAPPPPAAAISRPIVHTHVARLLQSGRLVAPTVIPKTIAIIKEESLPPDVVGGVVGGVPGGIPGGQLGGVLSGIIGGTGSSIGASIAPPAPVKRIVRVGGRVSPPRPVSTPPPIYPAIARNARVQGQVIIDAIIDEHGAVTEGHAISGPGLLVPAALAAVSNWKYEPTLLNGEPVSVQMHVLVNFLIE
ncbi:MAG TPA: energy transducer TonB [Candidatus Limnocylindria bacterium]|nr:energy transducer TonB [Candidatus Limnocylindria bacterium]